MKVKLTIQPCIFGDQALHNASMNLGPLTTVIGGKNKTQLFENIREKIWALSVSEAKIEDEKIAREYNSWISARYKQKSVPQMIENAVTAKMLYALPFSDNFKRILMDSRY